LTGRAGLFIFDENKPQANPAKNPELSMISGEEKPGFRLASGLEQISQP
jgi:hypothetical protein